MNFYCECMCSYTVILIFDMTTIYPVSWHFGCFGCENKRCCRVIRPPHHNIIISLFYYDNCHIIHCSCCLLCYFITFLPSYHMLFTLSLVLFYYDILTIISYIFRIDFRTVWCIMMCFPMTRHIFIDSLIILYNIIYCSYNQAMFIISLNLMYHYPDECYSAETLTFAFLILVYL